MTSEPNGMDRREALRRSALLLGGALSATTVAGVLAGFGSPEDGFATGAPTRALTVMQMELVATVADHIIPSTDTPGARAAGVPTFVDKMLAEYYTTEQRKHFIEGLAGLDDRARTLAAKSFVQLSHRQQRTVLDVLDRETFPKKPQTPVNQADKDTERGASAAPPADVKRSDNGGRAPARVPFFRMFKELTVVGYYTSQIGATRELKYNRVPGRFQGCVPFKTIGRAWSV